MISSFAKFCKFVAKFCKAEICVVLVKRQYFCIQNENVNENEKCNEHQNHNNSYAACLGLHLHFLHIM